MANPRAIFDKIGQETGNQTTTLITDGSLEDTSLERQEKSQEPLDEEDCNQGIKHSTSFQGLKDMLIDKNDLLELHDLEDETQIMEGLGQTTIQEKLKNLTPAEKYSKSIESQLGNVIKFKQDHFFVFSKRYPLYTAIAHDFEKKIKDTDHTTKG